MMVWWSMFPQRRWSYQLQSFSLSSPLEVILNSWTTSSRQMQPPKGTWLRRKWLPCATAFDIIFSHQIWRKLILCLNMAFRLKRLKGCDVCISGKYLILILKLFRLLDFVGINNWCINHLGLSESSCCYSLRSLSKFSGKGSVWCFHEGLSIQRVELSGKQTWQAALEKRRNLNTSKQTKYTRSMRNNIYDEWS